MGKGSRKQRASRNLRNLSGPSRPGNKGRQENALRGNEQSNISDKPGSSENGYSAEVLEGLLGKTAQHLVNSSFTSETTPILDSTLIGRVTAPAQTDKQTESRNDKPQAQRSDLVDWETRLQEREKELEAKEAELNSRQLEVSRLEFQAKEGFPALRLELQKKLQQQLEEFEAKLDTSSAELYSKRLERLQQFQEQLENWEQEIQSHIDQKLEEISEESTTLSAFRSDLEQEKRNLVRQRNELEAQAEFIQEKKNNLDELINRRLAVEQWKSGEDLQHLRDYNDALQRQIAQLEGRIRNWLEIAQYAEDQDIQAIADSPKLLLDYVQDLRKDRDQLRERIADIPDMSERTNAAALRDEIQRLEDKGLDKDREISELKLRLNSSRIAVIETETLRDQIKALEAARDVLRQQVKELKKDVDNAINNYQSESPFPLCDAMDRDPKLISSSPIEPDTAPLDLRSFVSDLRKTIAKEGFYYAAEDIRSFMAGLSMSWMTILQGISGTGKSSLPRLFAKVVRGECIDIEVQAGWRDRNDLLGYYNAFQERFYESPLLQGLYRAQLPANQERLFIILLDEMNLSFVEQYFADFLSTMEKPDGPRRINLIPLTEKREIPKYLSRENHNICIDVPNNVWFVGTANQDETTKDIADKTYDRSHVLELPSEFTKFTGGGSIQTVGCSRMSAAFDDARKKYNSEADNAINFLNLIRQDLGTYLRLGWGNRLTEKHVGAYVPVVCAAGGNWQEALDYILAGKVLRKARDRYDITYDDLTNARKAIADAANVSSEKLGEVFPKVTVLLDGECQKKTSG